MDTIKRLKLQNLRDEIVQDLDVEDIVDGLLSFDVITEDERDSIFSEQTRKARVRHLLDLLPTKGSFAFDNFVRNLKNDYKWLYSKLIEDTDPSQDEEKFLDALLLGGIPRTPPHNVERQETLLELRESLKSLTRGNYIVLHGMTGSGKSCLAAAAVENLPLVSKSFKDEYKEWLLLNPFRDIGFKLTCLLKISPNKIFSSSFQYHQGLITKSIENFQYIYI